MTRIKPTPVWKSPGPAIDLQKAKALLLLLLIPPASLFMKANQAIAFGFLQAAGFGNFNSGKLGIYGLQLAAGVKEFAEQVAGGKVQIADAGGADDGSLGTSVGWSPRSTTCAGGVPSS